MKRIITLQVLAGLLGILALIEDRIHLSYLVYLITAISGLIVQVYVIIGSIKQIKLMEFMLNENRRKTNLPEWDREEQNKFNLLRKRVELSTLQNQINPHFLYNTLDSIRSQALLEGQIEIADMTEKLSRFFRYCISNDEGMVKIREELNHIQDYYYIQKYRFEDRFNMIVNVEEEELYDLYIPKMTLQPLIENSIAHGLEKVSRKGMVLLTLWKTDNKVIIKVADNGMGMSFEALERLNGRLADKQIEVSTNKEKHNGIALMNVNSRIKLTFGEEYGIHYRSIENIGTDAEVIIPIIDEFQRVKYQNSLMTESSGEKREKY